MAERQPPFEAPTGWHWEVRRSDSWRLMPGKRCRAGASPSHKACGRPSVAELDRGTWWAYCERHMYANWIEDGVVVRWQLSKDGGATLGATP